MRNKNKMKKNFKYIDYQPLLKQKNYDIALCGMKKGTGKTFGAIRNGLINWEQNKGPFAYVRSTTEQLKEFMSEDKYGQVLDTLGWHRAKNETISAKGHFKTKYKTKKEARLLKTIMYALSLNGAMNIQSSKFEPLSLMILDEIQHHFNKGNTSNTFNKMINIVSSVLRDHNCPIWLLFNLVDENDLILRKFNADKHMAKLRPGQFKKIVRNFNTGKLKEDGTPEIVSLRILLWKPKESNKLVEDRTHSVANKLSFLAEGNYGNVMNSEEFATSKKSIKYINKLGKFRNIININGIELGLWTYKYKNKHGENVEVYQFSKKMNPNGRGYYFSYIDFDKDSLQGSYEFISKLKHKLIKRELEFEDVDCFYAVIDLFRLTKK